MQWSASVHPQQAHKADRITFTALTPWPGNLVCTEGRHVEGEGSAVRERRAAIFIGSEFGTVPGPDLVAAAREAGDAGLGVLTQVRFQLRRAFDRVAKLGRIPVLRARMNADLHRAAEPTRARATSS